MIEKVNPSHPDKVADRIAGALVDLAYAKNDNPKIAVEVLIGHGKCHIIAETSVKLTKTEVKKIVHRIAGKMKIDFVQVPQDVHLANNQERQILCGDNGIFKGMPLTAEQIKLSNIVRDIYLLVPSDGKYILNNDKLIACQSNVNTNCLATYIEKHFTTDYIVNPLGDWTGGTSVDTGATNRKLGSDMADSVTGGGLHGKDLSKADVSVNIYAFLEAQRTGKPVEMHCAIGDETVNGVPYESIVSIARNYIKSVGGFEKFAEWGLF